MPRGGFEDFMEYAVPDSLDRLHGPSSGRVELPTGLCWAPCKRPFDLGTRSDVKVVYQSVIGNGTLEDIEKYLDKNILVSYWPILNIPSKAAGLWHSRFPILSGNLREEWRC